MCFSPESTHFRSCFTCLISYSRTLPCASRQRQPLFAPPHAEASSNQLLLFADRVNSPLDIFTSLSLIVHPAALSSAAWHCACCTLKHAIFAFGTVDSCHLLGLCHPALHGQIPAGTVVACSTGFHQTSSIDTVHLTLACIHHDVLNPASASTRPFSSYARFLRTVLLTRKQDLSSS